MGKGGYGEAAHPVWNRDKRISKIERMQEMKRRLLALTFSAGLAVSLAACGSQNADTGSQTSDGTDDVLPGDAERIFTFGMSGGGAHRDEHGELYRMGKRVCEVRIILNAQPCLEMLFE